MCVYYRCSIGLIHWSMMIFKKFFRRQSDALSVAFQALMSRESIVACSGRY